MGVPHPTSCGDDGAAQQCPRVLKNKNIVPVSPCLTLSSSSVFAPSDSNPSSASLPSCDNALLASVAPLPRSSLPSHKICCAVSAAPKGHVIPVEYALQFRRRKRRESDIYIYIYKGGHKRMLMTSEL